VVVVIAPLLEVIALGPGDVAGAHEGGAHRLLVVADPADDGLTPDAQTVRAIRRSPIPVRALLRAKSGFSTSGSEMSKLQGAAQELLAAGVDGFAFGFLTPANDVDIDACLVLLQATDGLPWTFHRAIDYAFDHNLAWRELSSLPGLDTVLTAGSARGVDEGLDDLTARARRDPVAASLAMVGGGLTPEHVPWLARAGIAKFHLGHQVRPGGSWKAYVDPQLVRSWRILLDHEVAAAS
jgi:copper homeostasis protein